MLDGLYLFNPNFNKIRILSLDQNLSHHIQNIKELICLI